VHGEAILHVSGCDTYRAFPSVSIAVSKMSVFSEYSVAVVVGLSQRPKMQQMAISQAEDAVSHNSVSHPPSALSAFEQKVALSLRSHCAVRPHMCGVIALLWSMLTVRPQVRCEAWRRGDRQRYGPTNIPDCVSEGIVVRALYHLLQRGSCGIVTNCGSERVQ